MNHVDWSDRFWSKACPEALSGCWLWMAAATGGYGTFTERGRTFRAHRYAFALANGPISAGVVVRHRCDVPSCVNPDHLEAGSTGDNVADKVARRRHLFGSRHLMAKLTEAMVLRLRAERRVGRGLRELAVEFGVSEAAVSRAVRGVTWGHL